MDKVSNTPLDSCTKTIFNDQGRDTIGNILCKHAFSFAGVLDPSYRIKVRHSHFEKYWTEILDDLWHLIYYRLVTTTRCARAIGPPSSVTWTLVPKRSILRSFVATLPMANLHSKDAMEPPLWRLVPNKHGDGTDIYILIEHIYGSQDLHEQDQPLNVWNHHPQSKGTVKSSM